MNKTNGRFILTFAAALALLAGCVVVNPKVFAPVQGSGVVKTEVRSVSGFSQVSLNLVGKLYIERNGSESLSITSDDNILPLIKSEVRNGVLTLSMDGATSLNKISDLTYRVSVKNLDGLILDGAAEVLVSELDSKLLTVNINGAGKITLSGKAERQDVTFNGVGEYNAQGLESQIVKVAHHGIGKVVVRVSEALDARIEGAGVIEYIGNPKVTKVIDGLGSVVQK